MQVITVGIIAITAQAIIMGLTTTRVTAIRGITRSTVTTVITKGMGIQITIKAEVIRRVMATMDTLWDMAVEAVDMVTATRADDDIKTRTIFAECPCLSF